MNKIELSIISKTNRFVKKVLATGCVAHDWSHCERVFNTALYIAKNEIKRNNKKSSAVDHSSAACKNINILVVGLAAWLHDLDDWKFNAQHKITESKAHKWLKKLNLPILTINHVCKIICELPFKGNAVTSEMSSLEGKIVQDADRLDAIGAIGIARTFAYSGLKHRLFFDPTILPQTHTSFTKYKNAKSTTINHFYEKLLLLKDRMNTHTAKSIAIKRHKFMEKFLQNFFNDYYLTDKYHHKRTDWIDSRFHT